MSPTSEWSDDDVVEGLVTVLREHASAVDPLAAQHLARTTPAAGPRRRTVLVLAAAAAVVLVAVGSVAAVTAVRSGGPDATPADHGSVRPPATAPVSAQPRGGNRAAARAAAGRVFAAIPLPPGSTVRSGSPAPGLGHLGCQCGAVDPSLTRTLWAVVPLSYPRLLDWYRAHTPAEEGGSYYDQAQTQPAAHGGEFDWSSRRTSPRYSTPEIVFTYARLTATTTAVRADVTLAARYDRTAETLAPPDAVTSVEVTRSVLGLGSTGPHVAATITDPATVAAIVAAFDHLPGAYAGDEPGPCGSPTGTSYLYDLTFRWPGHTLASDPGAPLCGIGRGLDLDGRSLAATLDDTDALDHTLAAALASARRH